MPQSPLFRNTLLYNNNRKTPSLARFAARPSPQPVKTSFKIPTTSVTCRVKKTISSPDNSNFSGPQVVVKPRREKSLSMTDLPPVSIESDAADQRFINGSSSARVPAVGYRVPQTVGDGVHVSEVGRENDARMECFENGTGSLEENKAARLVCRVLMVNAWRRRRDDNSHLQDIVRQLTEQADHLRIQIVVLRRLLETENSRTGKLMSDMQQAKTKYEETVRERDTLSVEKEQAVQEVQLVKNLSEEKAIERENLRNELITLRTQLQALDTQISKDREKLLKLREDKKILVEKITTSDTLAAELTTRAESAEASAENLQTRLNAQVALLATAHEYQRQCSKTMKTKEEEVSNMEKQLQTSQEEKKTLALRSTNLECELSDREAALRRLESLYHSQLLELNELRAQLTRQSSEAGWGRRVLQLAGSMTRAPGAIFRTLSFLSNSGSLVS